jgi:SAM-dependent methyltransferase
VTGSEQARLWNAAGGNAWVDLQEVLDAAFAGIEELLADTVVAGGGRRVLDVGCGTGATTLAVARRLGDEGAPLGVDVSEPMIALARSRAQASGLAARFVTADAQEHPFEPAAFDTLISRFGVMFFEDPVRAFANLRGASVDGARLAAVVWRSAEENPFMTQAQRAAAPLLPPLPAPAPDAPGQFAFADPDRVRAILEGAGWTGVGLEAIDVPCAMPEAGLLPYLARLGPVGRALGEADPALRERVLTVLREAFAPYVDGPHVRFTAACWLVRARA